MTKNLAFALAAVMCAASFSACVFDSGDTAETESPITFEEMGLQEVTLPDVPESADTAEKDNITFITDKNEQDKISHQVYVNNGKEAIFKNHSSMTVDFDFGFEKPGVFADYYYLRPDDTYMTGKTFEEYTKDRVIYLLSGTDSDSEPEPMFFLDFSENYDGVLYWYVPEDEDVYYDKEHEHFTSMYIEDGVLRVRSIMDETLCQKYFEDNTNTEYTGGVIIYEAALDAETYEYSEVHLYLEKDNKTYNLQSAYLDYDQSEPEELGSLMSCFESDSEKEVTYTYTLNPGREGEVTQSLTVPEKMIVDFYSLDVPNPQIFTDYECTKPLKKAINGTKDVTLYVLNGEE